MSNERIQQWQDWRRGLVATLFPSMTPTPLEWTKTPVAKVEEEEAPAPLRGTCEGAERLFAWNAFVKGWAREKNMTVTQVSGLIAKRYNTEGELEMLINQGKDSKTGAEKPWQPFGGKVEYGENPIDALQRECKEEAGKDIDLRTVSYWKSYVQKPKPGATETYNIHAFVIENCDWDESNIQTGSDATRIKWVNAKTAFVLPDGTPRPMTPQTRHIFLSLGFVDPFGKQEIDDYDGDPTKLKI